MAIVCIMVNVLVDCQYIYNTCPWPSAVWPTLLHDQRGSINGANMGPFEDFYGAIMGLTSAKSVNLWSILRLFMLAVFTYRYQSIHQQLFSLLCFWASKWELFFWNSTWIIVYFCSWCPAVCVHIIFFEKIWGFWKIM